MPDGVEHLVLEGPQGAGKSVILPLMPDGVEHPRVA